MKQLLSQSRYLILVAVGGLLVASCILLGYGVFKIYETVTHTFILYNDPSVTAEHADAVANIGFIEIADTFLLASVFYIIAVGLYSLFIDDELQLPNWLIARDFAALKRKLIDVVIIILGIKFLARVTEGLAGQELALLGIGVGAVVASLAWYIKQQPSGKH